MPSERTASELPAIDWLIQLGYTHLPGKNVRVAQRHLAPILEEVLKSRLLLLNDWLASAPGGVDTALLELRKRANDDLFAANQKLWQEVFNRSDIQVKTAEGTMRSVRFFDPGNAANNDFHVVDQWVGRNADKDSFRPDLLLFINGLPLAIIECKDSHHSMDEALDQLDGYQRYFPAQFVFNQVCVGLNRRAATYAPIHTRTDAYMRYRLQAHERTHVAALLGAEPSEQDQLLWALFEPARFLQLACHMVLFETRAGITVKKLARYQQWRAVQKTLARLSGKPAQGGVIWHTQGSGKSLTMALLARLLRADSSGFSNPSILILTDRKNLDQQIFDTLHAVGIKARRAASVEGLLTLLDNNYGSILTSTLQKFQESDPNRQPVIESDESTESDDDDAAVASNPDNEMRDTPNRQRRIREGKDFFIVDDANLHFNMRDEHGQPRPPKWEEIARSKIEFRVLSTKANFYVLVDEAHRSQYDFLAAFMRASLPNAKFIAFTGTPLLIDDQKTLAEFGGGVYIDEYRLHEAVQDGATLPIKYQDAWVELAASSGLDQAFASTFATSTPARQHQLRAELLKKWRQAADRTEKIALHLVDHFISNVHSKKLKAMLVCNGRQMAVRYKDAIDAIMRERAEQGLPTFESRVAISLGSITSNRTGYSAQLERAKYNLPPSAIETIEERIRKEIKAGQTPVALPSDQIDTFVSKLFPLPWGDERKDYDGSVHANNVGLIIVSDMLLTGWDAPIVGTMYLDKPLKQHTLLQAIARVNRRLPEKNAGYIVDYHGVVDYLDSALKLYGGELQAAQVWSGVETELPRLQAVLERILKMLPRKHDPVSQRDAWKDDAERCLDPSTRIDLVEDFLEWHKQFNRSLDIILPDVRALPFKPWFVLLAEVRLMLRDKMPAGPAREKITRLESALLQQLLDEHIEASPARSLFGREVSILDAADMARLKQSVSGTSAALVMKNQLSFTIAAGREKDPIFFKKLSEQLEKLLEEERQGRINQAQFLAQLELFSASIRDKDNIGFATAAETAVYHYLAELLPAHEARAATSQLFAEPELASALAAPHWREMAGLKNEMKDLMRRFLIRIKPEERENAWEHSTRLLDILLKN